MFKKGHVLLFALVLSVTFLLAPAFASSASYKYGLDVYEYLDVYGDMFISGDLYIQGISVHRSTEAYQSYINTQYGILNSSRDVYINDNMDVYGVLYVSEEFYLKGEGIFRDDVKVQGYLDVQKGIISSTGDVKVKDDLLVEGELVVEETADFQDDIYSSEGNLTVDDTLEVEDDLYVYGDTFTGDIFPREDSEYSLGSWELEWYESYIDRMYSFEIVPKDDDSSIGNIEEEWDEAWIDNIYAFNLMPKNWLSEDPSMIGDMDNQWGEGWIDEVYSYWLVPKDDDSYIGDLGQEWNWLFVHNIGADGALNIVPDEDLNLTPGGGIFASGDYFWVESDYTYMYSDSVTDIQSFQEINLYTYDADINLDSAYDINLTSGGDITLYPGSSNTYSYNIMPDEDGAYDLGSEELEWEEGWIDTIYTFEIIPKWWLDDRTTSLGNPEYEWDEAWIDEVNTYVLYDKDEGWWVDPSDFSLINSMSAENIFVQNFLDVDGRLEVDGDADIYGYAYVEEDLTVDGDVLPADHQTGSLGLEYQEWDEAWIDTVYTYELIDKDWFGNLDPSDDSLLWNLSIEGVLDNEGAEPLTVADDVMVDGDVFPEADGMYSLGYEELEWMDAWIDTVYTFELIPKEGERITSLGTYEDEWDEAWIDLTLTHEIWDKDGLDDGPMWWLDPSGFSMINNISADDVYIQNFLDVDGRLEVDGNADIYGYAYIEEDLTMGGDVLPESDGTGSLGSMMQEWGEAWIDDVFTYNVLPKGPDSYLGNPANQWYEGWIDYVYTYNLYDKDDPGYNLDPSGFSNINDISIDDAYIQDFLDVDGLLEVDSNADIYGDLAVGGVVVPMSDGSGSLGTMGLEWGEAWIDTVNTYSLLPKDSMSSVGAWDNEFASVWTDFIGSDVNIVIAPDNNLVLTPVEDVFLYPQSGDTFSYNILPDEDGTYDLGSWELEWDEGFIDTVYAYELIPKEGDIGAENGYTSLGTYEDEWDEAWIDMVNTYVIYDKDDFYYYLDPSGFSNINDISIDSAYVQNFLDVDGMLEVDGNANIWGDLMVSSTIVPEFDGSGSLGTPGQEWAEAFIDNIYTYNLYDKDDPGYNLDPSGFSNLNALSADAAFIQSFLDVDGMLEVDGNADIWGSLMVQNFIVPEFDGSGALGTPGQEWAEAWIDNVFTYNLRPKGPGSFIGDPGAQWAEAWVDNVYTYNLQPKGPGSILGDYYNEWYEAYIDNTYTYVLYDKDGFDPFAGPMWWLDPSDYSNIMGLFANDIMTNMISTIDLTADYIDVYGGINSADIMPLADGTYDLGSPGLEWDEAWIDNVNTYNLMPKDAQSNIGAYGQEFANIWANYITSGQQLYINPESDLYLQTQNNDIYVQPDEDLFLNPGTNNTYSSNLLPYWMGSWDLGTPVDRWDNVYANNVDADSASFASTLDAGGVFDVGIGPKDVNVYGDLYVSGNIDPVDIIYTGTLIGPTVETSLVIADAIVTSGGGATFDGDVLPSEDGMYDLGSWEYEWDEGFIDTVWAYNLMPKGMFESYIGSWEDQWEAAWIDTLYTYRLEDKDEGWWLDPSEFSRLNRLSADDIYVQDFLDVDGSLEVDGNAYIEDVLYSWDVHTEYLDVEDEAYIEDLEVYEIWSESGEIWVDSSLIPDEDGEYDLGSWDYEWDDAYIDSVYTYQLIDKEDTDYWIDLTDDSYFNNIYADDIYADDADFEWLWTEDAYVYDLEVEYLDNEGPITVGTDLIPGEDGMYDLGSAMYEWDEAWIDFVNTYELMPKDDASDIGDLGQEFANVFANNIGASQQLYIEPESDLYLQTTNNDIYVAPNETLYLNPGQGNTYSSNLLPYRTGFNLGSMQNEWGEGWIDTVYAYEVLPKDFIGGFSNLGNPNAEWDEAWIDQIFTYEIFDKDRFGYLNPSGESLIMDLNIQGDIYNSIGNVTVGDNLVVTGWADFQSYIGNTTGDLTIRGNTVPWSDSAFDLGSSADRWDELYVNDVNADYIDANDGYFDNTLEVDGIFEVGAGPKDVNVYGDLYVSGNIDPVDIEFSGVLEGPTIVTENLYVEGVIVGGSNTAGKVAFYGDDEYEYVSFSEGAYDSPPVVVVSMEFTEGGGWAWQCAVFEVTTDGFEIGIDRDEWGTVIVNWIAVANPEIY